MDAGSSHITIKYCSKLRVGLGLKVSRSLFEVEQVAVNFVVNIGIILLLAQVQAGDVHCGLKQKSSQQAYTIFLNMFEVYGLCMMGM